eukprot:CAMPEP_0170598508 /NCGR_PEP_ID=MMETSP0224-20130122/16289_1 /TAXON_ID=285029 /ORGANISM="Togula jolla, Strain CCCM 725" /LENGTH=697 /DNA_ID=CAMNT_0010923073 /DNA_START=44 /DNA_END=2137 /DNA_ORIENTATION=-
MKTASGVSVLLLLVLAFSPVDAAANVMNPVQKILQMLTEMKAKGVSEMSAEKTIFAEYDKYVQEQTRELKEEISSSTQRSEKLLAAITKGESDTNSLSRKISETDGEVSAMEADQKASTEQREAEHDSYLKAQTDYSESLYALDRAIETLSSQNFDRAQAMLQLEHSARSLPGMRRVLGAVMLAQQESRTARREPGAPAVAAYEFQSSSIIEVLKQLKIRFKEELSNLETEEANMAHAYSLEMLHTGNVIANLKSEREDLAATSTRIASEVAAAKGDLADTKASLKEAKAFLSELTATHSQKSATFEVNQQVRAEEIEAIGKALEVLSDPKVVEAYSEHVKVLTQLTSATQLSQGSASGQLQATRKLNFLQLRTESRASTEPVSQHRLLEGRAGALALLQKKAQELDSKVLSALAEHVGDSPFAKVIDMIEGLLARLKEEAASEADHKSFCDTELQKNKLARDKHSSRVAQLLAEVDEKKANIEGMAKDLAVLAEEQAELRKVLGEATEIRSKEKASNLEAIKDAQVAQVAVKQAVVILKEFYAKQGESLLQSKSKQVPEMEAYSGMQGKEGGVVGMLEVIQSDFSRLEADTQAAENQAASQFAEFSKTAEADLKSKHDAEFKLSLKKDQAEFEHEQLVKDRDATQTQLDTATAYYEELKPQCLTVHVTFEERVQRREEEIEALHQAYRILNGEAAE